MNKILIISFVATFFILTGCEETVQKDEDTPLEHKAEEIIHSILKGDVEVLVIDGCQYIVYKEVEGTNLAYGFMAHKGNCNNPIHCYNIPVIEADTLKTTDQPAEPTE